MLADKVEPDWTSEIVHHNRVIPMGYIQRLHSSSKTALSAALPWSRTPRTHRSTNAYVSGKRAHMFSRFSAPQNSRVACHDPAGTKKWPTIENDRGYQLALRGNDGLKFLFGYIVFPKRAYRVRHNGRIGDRDQLRTNLTVACIILIGRDAALQDL